MPSQPALAAIPVQRALFVIGSIGLAIGMVTILVPAWAYSSNHDFSLFTTYISDFGVASGWPQAIYTAGMLIAAPIRYLFLFLLLTQLVHLGASHRFRSSMLVIGTFVLLGSIGTAAVPYSLHLPTHKASALLYFFGTVALQLSLVVQEWRLRLPALLPLSSIAVVAFYFVFAALLALVGKVDGIDRATPVPWEWLCFVALMVWLGAHTAILGASQRKQA